MCHRSRFKSITSGVTDYVRAAILVCGVVAVSRSVSCDTYGHALVVTTADPFEIVSDGHNSDYSTAEQQPIKRLTLRLTQRTVLLT